MVSDVTFSGQVANAQTTVNSQVTLAEDFSEFLELLTTQLQNQDPLEPLDSNQFTEQLVQFSQVEQQINANQKLDDLVALGLNNAITTSLGYVGLDVSYVSAELAFDGTNPAPIRYSLGANAATSTINIFDEEGSLVQSLDAETAAGVHNFEWDGRDLLGNPVPAGTYVVSVDSLDLEENVIDTTTVVTGRVKGIEQQNGVVYALVGDRAVATTAILNAQVPENNVTETEGGTDAPAT
jgi:flagellar basal-body rod modification protein FlgD